MFSRLTDWTCCGESQEIRNGYLPESQASLLSWRLKIEFNSQGRERENCIYQFYKNELKKYQLTKDTHKFYLHLENLSG